MAGGKIAYHADGSIAAILKKFKNDASTKAVTSEFTTIKALNERIMELTPVWEGDVMVNWRWSTSAPIYDHIDPRGQDIPPGHTNKMPLGDEPRRAVNETRVRQSLASALKAKNPVDIYLTNSSPHAVDLEYGLLPTRDTSRVGPGGILRLAIKEIIGRLR